MRKPEILLVVTLALIQFVHIVDFMMMMPLSDRLMRLFDIGPGMFSWLVSSYNFSACVSGFLGVFWLDKVDRKRALLFAFVGFIVGTIGCGLANSYYVLLTGRVVAGAFGGILSASVFAIIGDAFPIERRATAMGLVMASFSLASVLGVPIGLIISDMYDWHMPFLSIGAVGVLVLVFSMVYVPVMDAHVNIASSQPKNDFWEMFAHGNIWLAIGFMTLLILGQFTIIPFIAPYMIRNVGFTQQDLKYIYLCGGIATVFTTPLIGKLSDLFGRKRMFFIISSITVIPLILITNLPPVSLVVALVCSTIFYIFAGGRMIPATTIMTQVVPSKFRGRFMSINSSAQSLASGLAASIAGFIVVEGADGKIANYHYVGYFAITATLLALLISVKLKESSES